VKSEFMMVPNTIEKQVHEYQTKLVALEEQLSKSVMCWFTIMRIV
jgi:mitotic spindle assembly checkpoint protein MAD1